MFVMVKFLYALIDSLKDFKTKYFRFSAKTNQNSSESCSAVSQYIVSVLQNACIIGFEKHHKWILKYQIIDVDYNIGQYRYEMVLSGLGNTLFCCLKIQYRQALQQSQPVHAYARFPWDSKWHEIKTKCY